MLRTLVRSETVRCGVSQVTSVETESTDSLPHTVISTTDSHPAVDSGETDHPATTGCDAADHGDMASGDNGQLTAATASVGSDTVSPAAANNSTNVDDVSSADKTESATETENIESHEEGGEAASGAEVSESKESTEKCPETDTGMNETHAGDGDKAAANQSASDNATSAVHAAMATDEPSKSPDDIGDKDVSDFLALSYLVHPPDGPTFDLPYADEFWKCRWARMESELKRMLRKSTRLASDVITLDSSSSESESSDGEFSEDYEDSMASNSPIFVQEKKAVADEDDKDECDEIVLDENSSNAIVVGDDEEEDDDEIFCSGDTNDDDKNGASSVVICDGENSIVESSPPGSSVEPSVDGSQQLPKSSNCGGSVAGVDSAITTGPDVSDKCAEAEKVANGSADVEDPVVRSDKPGGSESQTASAVDDESLVRNGACSVNVAAEADS